MVTSPLGDSSCPTVALWPGMPTTSGSGFEDKDFPTLEASVRDLMAAGSIKARRQVEEGMADLVKARYLTRLNPDAPRSEKARYLLTIPPGYTPEGIAWNIERMKSEQRAMVETVGGSARWPRWYQDAWLTHRRYKGSGRWNPDYWTDNATLGGPHRNVAGAWVDVHSGELLSERAGAVA